tara:strand:+ start:83 stop:247 length:165 start_codon:yes stop_codon:yes gene_type:complete
MDAGKRQRMLLLLKKTKSTLRAIIPDGFVSNPFEPDTLLQQRKRVSRQNGLEPF